MAKKKTMPAAIDDRAPEEMELATTSTGGVEEPPRGVTPDPELEALLVQLRDVGDPEGEMRAATKAYVDHKLAHEAAVRDGERKLMELNTAKRRAESDGNRRLAVIRVLRAKIAALGG